MIEQDVLYERNMTGSYMKIEASENASFDERMLFSGKISGLLPVEQCFVNGKSWYWYNISGKQSLDTYCKMQDIGVLLIEKIIISICDEIDILEWNLFDLNCLLLSPEYIFINNINQEIIFTVYPGLGDDLSVQFRELMEYLLTRVDHKDVRAVQTAYGIYEKTLDEAYDIMDIRDYVVMGRTSGSEEVKIKTEEKVQMQASAAEEQIRKIEVKAESTRKERAQNEIRQEEKGLTGRENKKSVFTDIMQILNEWKQSIRRVKKSVAPEQEEARYRNSYISQLEAPWMGDVQQRPLQVAERINYGRSSIKAGNGWNDGKSIKAGSGWNDGKSIKAGSGWDEGNSVKAGNGGDDRNDIEAGGWDDGNLMNTESGWYGSKFADPENRQYGGANSGQDYETGQTTVLSGYGDFIKGVLVYEGMDELENISLQQKDVQIGKMNSSDVCIPKSTISQFHARITYKDGDYFLEDLNSTNGTYVNDKALAYKEVRKLAMNDMIRFADVSYRFI